VSYTSPVDVLLVLTRGTEVLLALREGTGYADGQWNLPSGKLEEGEHALVAMVREAREEIGIRLGPADLLPAGTVHFRNPEGQGRVGLFFAVESDPGRQGEPVNAEPHKCAKIDWFSLDMLPENTVRYTAVGIGLHRQGGSFVVAGW
jgi:8-oxo-dGTP diphosphatase